MMRRGAACQACPLQGDKCHSNQARGHKKLVFGMISTRISGIPTNPFAIGVLGKPWPVPTNGARLKPNAASKSPKAKPPSPKPSSPLTLIGKCRGYEVLLIYYYIFIPYGSLRGLQKLCARSAHATFQRAARGLLL